MSYNPRAIYDDNGLFEFEEYGGTCSLKDYLKKNDPNITEIEIPAECRGFPVKMIETAFIGAKYIKRVAIPPSVGFIGNFCFCDCISLESVEFSEGLGSIDRYAFMGDVSLKTITFPKSLKSIGSESFAWCRNLESVVINSPIQFGVAVFKGCEKLPADITLMGLVNSVDLTQPLDKNDYIDAFSGSLWGYDEEAQDLRRVYTRTDVLKLALKNDCFRSVDVFPLLKYLIETGYAEALLLTEKYNLLKTRGQVDEYISRSAEEGLTELTAYLLDYKNRKFGFNGGDDFEL